MTTQTQKIHLNAELWPDACRHQGWHVTRDRAKLYDIYARVLGEHEPHKSTLAEGGKISCKAFVLESGRDDFGDVKRELLILAGKDLVPDNSVKHNHLWSIRNRLMPCYRVYRPEAALETILRERFKRIRFVNGIDDLGADDLKKLIYTLEARINDCRNDSGHTHHEMCDQAGVKPWRCPTKCERCAQIRAKMFFGNAPAVDQEDVDMHQVGVADPAYAPPENTEQEAF